MACKGTLYFTVNKNWLHDILGLILITLNDRSQRVKVGRHYSEEVRVTSGYLKGAFWAHFCS